MQTMNSYIFKGTLAQENQFNALFNSSIPIITLERFLNFQNDQKIEIKNSNIWSKNVKNSHESIEIPSNLIPELMNPEFFNENPLIKKHKKWTGVYIEPLYNQTVRVIYFSMSHKKKLNIGFYKTRDWKIDFFDLTFEYIYLA
jgi:hypothetical protein